ncbi:glutamine synthetase/guanido kinase [Leucogyrophana mollusca]|uniref:Glutamine synthetase/guanido kinase n=1 Tax=Leucogyrophana mollusca TaxID=85980 RepID=A0ACB8B9V4_9AGAM|nr:glutamine synthetase/guanido kinase [Leucogyrophana mollusca]
MTVIPGFNAVGEYLYVVDTSTLRICPYAPGHAVVFGHFQEKTPVLGANGIYTLSVPICPRTILGRIVKEAKENHGVEFLVGVETEFILLESVNPIVPANPHVWCDSMATATGTVVTKVIEEIAEALLDAGIDLHMYHSEATAGQYEIITGPLPPLEAADALVHTRETIYNIANKHGLRATLAPRLDSHSCGSSSHAHISIHGGSMADGIWAGGTYVAWGVDNREVPVRLCNATSPSSRNFEVKTVDGTANPYVALAGLLGAGMTGVQKGCEVQLKNCIGAKTAAQMSDEERSDMGITTRIPLSLDEARASLNEDLEMRGTLGDVVVDTFLSLNEIMEQEMGAGSEEEVLTRLVSTY